MTYEVAFPENPPVKVFETGVGAVTAGAAGVGGWVSGNPANLASSATVDCVFDLGQDWAQYTKASISVLVAAPSSGASNLVVSSSATAAFNVNRMLNEVDGATFGALNASIAASTLSSTATVRPMGRYLIVRMSNADAANALGAASRVTVAAYPG